MVRQREELTPLTLGAIVGAAAAAAVAPLFRPLFRIPSGAIGYVTMHRYPKGWDYAVAALVVAGSFAGALIAAHRTPSPPLIDRPRPRWVAIAIAVFAIACVLHDLPYAPLDFFHEGEHLTPAFLLRSGERPYRDVFFLHGFAADGGLDALIPGEPSLVVTRRISTVLGAATLALLAPIAAELCATTAGTAAATFAALCVGGAGLMRLFPYFRLAPLLIAALGFLRCLRTRSVVPLAVAVIASTTGLLWSLDTGVFAVAGTVVLLVAMRVRPRALIAIVIAALLAPLIILVATRASLPQFFADSFVTIPRAVSVVWSLPAPAPPPLRDLLLWLPDLGGRYYVALVVYGLAFAVAVRRWRGGGRVAAARIAVVAMFALLLFRSLAARCDPNHANFALPLFGILAVALVVEPLVMRSRVTGTIIATMFFIVVLNVIPNLTGTVDALAEWPARHRPGDSGVANSVASLGRYLASLDRNATVLVASNDRALYALVNRRSPARCLDVMLWSYAPLLDDEMRRVRAHPPACVVVDGYAENAFDGLTMNDRVPQLMRWVSANYPRRLTFGRFVVAAK